HWRLRLLVRGAVLLSILAAILIATAMVRYTIRFPDPSALRQREQAPVVRVLARDGTVLVERGSAARPVPLAELPPHVIHAVVAIEDRRFFSHIGLDFRGFARAMLANLRAARYAQGGSTLTQQLAKNLFLTSDRTMERKLEEIILALWLELRLGKPGIMELYLNRVYFGAGVYGVEAAAQRYFGKSARTLTVPEAAIIAGLLKAPSRLSPASRPELAASRAVLVLAAMRDEGFISEAGFNEALHQQVTLAASDTTREETGLEFAVDYALERLPPLAGHGQSSITVETTLDADLQRRAQAAIARRLASAPSIADTAEAAVVVLDHEGGIRAMVGGRAWSRSQFNRAIRARRQPGSAFKPVLYLAAIEAGLTPESTVQDRPITIGSWSPRNDSGSYAGAMTLRRALAHSVNTVAVILQRDIGTERVVAMARRLGITSTLRADASLALGTSEVTLLELTGAYGALANGGVNLSPHVIRRVRTDRGMVLHARGKAPPLVAAASAHVGKVNDMLHTAMVAGTGRRAVLAGHDAAGKTGTTQDNRDAWFVGFTGHLTAGVWVGNDDNSPMRGVSGSGLPALIWRDIMQAAHRGLEPAALPGVSDTIAPPAPAETPVASAREPVRVAPRPALRPSAPIDPALFAAPKEPAGLDTRRLEALLMAE
ncbi:MAG: PBP1A family penicillin-binding protein, partial [Hyphomicrobium sp.]|nr:PBP1A family penicillin-binding protein [Hyphomicrobium sp.]